MQSYFGPAKAACLCSYSCNGHLCYDGGTLGRVKIVTLRVGARAKEGTRGGGGEKNTEEEWSCFPGLLPNLTLSEIVHNLQ